MVEQESNYFWEVLVPVLIGTVSVAHSQTVREVLPAVRELKDESRSAHRKWSLCWVGLVGSTKAAEAEASLGGIRGQNRLIWWTIGPVDQMKLNVFGLFDFFYLIAAFSFIKENMLAQLITHDLTLPRSGTLGGQSGPALASGYLWGSWASCFLLNWKITSSSLWGIAED